MTARILFISDSHLLEDREERLFGVRPFETLRAVTRTISLQELPFDLMVAMGDLSQDGSTESYRDFHMLTGNLAKEVIWVPGNHDDFSRLDPDMKPFLKGSWHRDNWHLLFLDSSQRGREDGILSTEEMTRLNNFLESHRDGRLLIALHHQPVEVGSRFIDLLGLRNPEDFWGSLEGHPGVKALLFGHVHQEVDRKVLGIRLLSVPATSVPFRPGSDEFALDQPKRGYRTLSLQPGGTFSTATRMIATDHGIDMIPV